MTSPMNPEPDPLSALSQIWLAASAERPPRVDPSALGRAARRLRRRVLIRNLSEWGVACVLVAFCVQRIVTLERLLGRLGFLGVALAALYISFELHRRGRVATPLASSTESYRRAHLAALERQARLLESVWRWYLLPFVPGITLVHLDATLAALARSGAQSTIWLVSTASLLFTLLVFLAIGALNGRAARDLRREMRALTER